MSSIAGHSSDVWPASQDYLRPIVCTCYLLLLCLLSILFSQRIGTWKQLKRMPIMQLLVMSLLGGSLLFIFASAIIVLGVGSSYSNAACSTGIWLCIFLYAVTKAVLYVLLLEKLHVVHCHTAAGKMPRWKSWWYRVGAVLFVCWLGVAIAMIIGRVALVRQHDGACIIGLRLYATVPMLTVDAVTNIYLTTAFIIPIWKSNFPKAQRLARVSAIAAVAALLTSFANIFVLTLQHGHQLSWVCLGSCGLDVSFNSIAVFFVTTANRQRDEATTTAGSMITGDHVGTGMKGRTSRNASLFPGSAANPFTMSSVGVGGVGVTITEEVRVEEDDDIPLPPLRRPSQHPLVPPTTTISFREPRFEADSDEESLKTPAIEKQDKPDAKDYMPKAL
ncbi:hypothetical protein JCM8547_005288 [Rhodosporidiobolus lusitaniae]